MTERNAEIEERLRNAEWVLEKSGFRRCDIAACNCGSWHQVGGFKARFDEINEVVDGAGYSTNGRVLLDAVKAMAADAAAINRLRAEAVERGKALERTQIDVDAAIIFIEAKTRKRALGLRQTADMIRSALSNAEER